jgi:hypothetical protein
MDCPPQHLKVSWHEALVGIAFKHLFDECGGRCGALKQSLIRGKDAANVANAELAFAGMKTLHRKLCPPLPD